MSLAATDLILFGSNVMAETDGITQGGAIDLTTIIVPNSATLFNAMSGGKIDFVSSNAGDTSQTVTITGRDNTGAIITESPTLNGTTLVNGGLTYNRIEKIVISATCVGTVTFTAHTGGTTIAVLPPGVKTIRRCFYNVASDVSGGSTRNYYEKFFLKNTNGTFAALGLTAKTNTDVGSGDCQLAVASAVNDTGTSTNRQTAPSGITGAGFGDGPTAIPGTDLAPGATIGIWLNLTLSAALAAAVTTYTPEFDFQSI